MNEPLNIQLTTREMYITRESGNVEGVWLKLPATAKQLNAALTRIGVQNGEHGRDYFINGIETPLPAFDRISIEKINKAGIDELNCLAAALQSYDDRQVAKFNAAVEIMVNPHDIHQLTELTQNIDVYDFHPDIYNNIQLGENCLEHSGLIQIPDEWAAAIDVEMLGRLANEHEKGKFTEYGYIVPNGEEWKPVNKIPQEYCIASHIEKPQIDYDTVATFNPTVNISAVPIMFVSDNPRDKIKEITTKLESGIKGIFESEQYKSYLCTLSKFHNYSFNNCLLIAMQKPDASHIAGFNAWRDTFKRQVRKGEKGIKILAPAPYKAVKEVERIDTNGQPVFDSNGQRVKDTIETTIPSFKITTVFDVSQTDGEPLPQIGVSELTGSVDRYKDFFAALEKTSNVPIVFEAVTGGAKGYYNQEEKRIVINESMSELQNLKTLIHEIAHSRLHDIDKNAPVTEPRPDRRTREVEAESIAYTVCQHYGLDTSDYSFGYVATWSGDKQLDTLKASLDIIRKEADAIISEVDKHFAELIQDKEQSQEKPTSEFQPEYADVLQKYNDITGTQTNMRDFIQLVSDGLITNQLLNCPFVISDIPNYEHKDDSPNYQRVMDLIAEIRNIYHSDIIEPELPIQGENVAAIEAKVKVGESINLSELSVAMKKDKVTQTMPVTDKSTKRTNKQSKTAEKTKQPSIKEKIAEGKKEIARQKSAPTRAAVQNNNKGLGE